MRFSENTIYIPHILLPVNAADPAFMRAWSVIACDQFTSDRGYWDELDRETGGAPSTLRLILPEAYLQDADAAEKIAAADENMERYLAAGIFRRLPRGFVLTERTFPNGAVRRGLLLAVDLENYSFTPGEQAAVRATEATVPERLPPRMAVRRGAKLELPHVILLYDAPEADILPAPAAEGAPEGKALYDFELNRGGGHLRGWFLSEESAREIRSRLYASAKDGFLFAVGDGNHSLAAAKRCWEEKKGAMSAAERENHPARYALCEAVSVRSPAVVFHPIHRIVTGVDAAGFLSALQRACPFPVLGEGRIASFSAGTDVAAAIAFTDKFISSYTAERGGGVDYIHGGGELEGLVSAAADRAGVRFEPVGKADFFRGAAANGVFPRKTFSVGEGYEKRYYTECKEI